MKVLIVDDSKLNREFIKKELVEGGYETIEATSGKEAISKLIMNNDIDLVSLDVEMDGINGFETLYKIRNENFTKDFPKDIPVVFVTANDTIQDRIKGFNLGATDFVSKNFLHGELLSVIDSILKPNNEFEGSTILVVDDSSLTRKVIRNIVKTKGINVIEAEDGIEGIKLLEDQKDNIDLIISDVLMKKMNGDEFCYHVKKKMGLKDIPLIILSAVSMQDKIIQLYKMGASDYIIKPFFKEEFLARVTTYLKNVKNNKLIKNNINELKITLERLNETQQEVIDLEKKNSVLAMAVTANHEINQPLTILQMNIDLLLLDMDKEQMNENQKKSIDTIISSINEISDILNRYKNIKNIEFKKYDDLSEMVDFNDEK